MRGGGYRSVTMMSIKLRFAKFASLVLTCCILLVGCATTPQPPAPNISQDEPESFEKAAFDVLSDYYCAQSRWPTAWTEIEEFQRSRGEDAVWLQAVKDPKISSPRAIFLTLSYTSAEGAQRRATYIAPPRCGKESKTGFVEIAAGGVVFKLPDGFELMSIKDVQQRWKAPPYPDAAWSASDGRVLAIRFGDVEIKPEELPQFAEDMAEAYESSIPSLVWTFKDSKTISGKPVLYHEFQSAASSGSIVNVVFSSAFDSRLFAITITGPTEKADAVLQAARQVEQSLQIR
jgi:hypothetical protein